MRAAHIPKPATASYRAAAHIYIVGPLTPADLFAAIACGDKPSSLLYMLESALRTGWLVEACGLIELGNLARTHFGEDEPEKPTPKYQGIAATTREPLIPVYERPPLSAKYKTNSRGNRADVPAFSVRQAPSFRAVPTGGA